MPLPLELPPPELRKLVFKAAGSPGRFELNPASSEPVNTLPLSDTAGWRAVIWVGAKTVAGVM